MGVFSLIFSFVFIYFALLFSSKERETVFSNIRLAFIKSSLIMSLLAVVSTEGFSFLKMINSASILAFWGMVLLLSALVFFWLFKKNKWTLKQLNLHKLGNTRKVSPGFKVVILLAFIIIAALFFVAFTINNNWDSYTYHLPRVEHWIQNGNVDFYPTNNVRQLYLAPFAEYLILNIRLLSGDASFVNFVQFFSMINCLLIASLIARIFGLNKEGQITAGILVLTIPMGLLQATTTQTDYVVSFFISSFVLFGLMLVKEKKINMEGVLFLSLSFSLAILTKSTAYIFLFPFCLAFGIYFVKLFKGKSLQVLFIVVVFFVLLNTPFLLRNYRQFGSVLGPQKTSSLYLASLNEEFGVKIMFSNLAKNVSMHISLPNKYEDNIIYGLVDRFHAAIGYPLDTQKTNFFGIKYDNKFLLSQDSVGNFAHGILIIVSLIIFVMKFKRVSGIVRIYIYLLISAYMLFAFLLKWQPWQTRLDLPVFILISPFLAYVLLLAKNKFYNVTACMLLLLVAFGIVFVFDPIKPVFGDNSIFKNSTKSYILMSDTANKVEAELSKDGIIKVGLFMGSDSLVWQYWLISKNKIFQNIYFPEELMKTTNFNSNFKYKAVIIDKTLRNDSENYIRINKFIGEKNNIEKIIDMNDVLLVVYKKNQNKIVAY
ncbi:MAG TPA: hypothetical protein VF817_04630 [Patescibacteria group bacterium]